MRKFLLILPLILFTAACQQPAPKPRPISFTQYPPIALNVSHVKVSEAYNSPMKRPHVEHFLPTSPAEAMDIWVKDRMRAVGGTRTLEVIIKDASVVEEGLPRTGGFKGVYTVDQAERYAARLEVEMRIYGDSAMSEASINIVATRSDTAAENFSAAKRDEMWDRMVRDLMAVANAELERNIHQYFSNYIRYTPAM